MREENGPYGRQSFDDSQQCVNVEVRQVPEGWEPILNPKRPQITLAGVLAALAAWGVVAISTIATLAR